MTPSQALQAHSQALTGFEQSEILTQQDIYFLGLSAKKIEGQPHSADLNHGLAPVSPHLYLAAPLQARFCCDAHVSLAVVLLACTMWLLLIQQGLQMLMTVLRS